MPDGFPSAENLELIRRAYEAFNRKDADIASEFLAEDAEWHGTVGGLTEGNVYRGREGIAEELQPTAEEWDEWRIEPRQVLGAGPDRVVVLSHEAARGKLSGIAIEADTAAIFTMRDGKIACVEGFMDQEEALRAAGLDPDAARNRDAD